MIYYFHFLFKNSFMNLFGYITFRTFMAVLTGFFFSVFLYPKFIEYLRKIKAGQSIRSDGPASHLIKSGTPTMGGALIIVSVFVNVLLWNDFVFNTYVQLTVFILLSFGALGFYDDFLNIKKKGKLGLKARDKFIIQILLAAVVMTILYIKKDYSTTLYIPVIKHLTIDIGWWYIPFGVLVIVGTSNAVNLTDGMDGLATVPSVVSTVLMAAVLYLVGHAELSRYLHLFYINGAGELAIIAGAVIGSAMAFLWYNTYPAQIFMGDTGSLTLGALLGIFTIITKTELLSLIFNGLFVVEVLSVILQVGSFKLRGKRIFRMAPIHHHFEVKGNTAEPKLVVRFWIVAILLAIVSIAMIKVR